MIATSNDFGVDLGTAPGVCNLFAIIILKTQ